MHEYATEYELDTALVMAIIETESSFNPRAKSWANAYGLMQIVPKFAGRESWRDIYGEDGIPSAEYLFDPVNNIRHGACYLRILQGHYGRKVPEGARRDQLVIASYNWGATAVRRLVRKVFGAPHEGDDQEVLRLLTTRTPKETRDHLERVTSRRAKWTAE